MFIKHLKGHGDRYIGSLFRVDEPVPDDSLDGNRSGWYGFDWDIRFQGTCHSHPAFLPLRAHCILDRIESRVILKEGDK